MAKKKKTDLSHIAEDLRSLAHPILGLVSDPANARKHGQKNLGAIKSSLARYGQRKPLVVNTRGMIVEAGNGTLAAARELGWSHLAIVRVDEDSVTAAGFGIADNRSAELAEWDTAALTSILGAIDEEEPELDLGFSDEDIEALLAEEAAANPVEPGEDPGAGELPAEPQSKRGEVDELGPHRLLCGDSTIADDVSALLGGEEPNLMVTDPPYGVNYDAAWRKDCGLNSINSSDRLGLVENDDRADWRDSWDLFPGDVVYVWHASIKSPEVASTMSGFDLRGLICWVKPCFPISRGHYHHQHEPCWYAVRGGKTASWIGDRKQTTVWKIKLDKNLEGDVKHSTQKPVECMERPIRNHKGDVYDPFLGSGTTLIAAARQGRRCFGIEISPAYCDVIRKRWGDYARANGVEPGHDAL